MLRKSTADNHVTQNTFVPNKQGELKKPEKQLNHKKNDNILFLKENAEQFWLVLIKPADNLIRAEYVPNQLKDTIICSISADCRPPWPPLWVSSHLYRLGTTSKALYFKHSKDTNPEAAHIVKQDDGDIIAAPTFPCLQQKGSGRKLPLSCRAAHSKE